MRDMRTDLGKLSDDWMNIDSIVLYGAGTVANICKDVFAIVNVRIECIVDQDPEKHGKLLNSIPIVSYENAGNMIRNHKVVVAAAHTAFNDIAEFLNNKGLKEFEDFCRIGQFISEWMWKVKGLNCVFHTDMTVTTLCSLNCTHCNMFIPYYKERKNYSYEELKRNIDLLFERVDYVVYLGLIGGEPTLNTDLGRIIEYLYETCTPEVLYL